MWAQFKRVIKPRGTIVLTASQPFTSRLVCSNLEMFRYEWVWEKPMATQFMNANVRPLNAHETILIFSDRLSTSGVFAGRNMNYSPQMGNGEPWKKRRGGLYEGYHLKARISTFSPGTRYPRSVLHFGNSNQGSLHPAQKPIELFAYLIRTYTQPGDLVLDPVAGSGTTAIAARNEGRHFICGDSSAEYVAIARNRLAEPFTPPLFTDTSVMDTTETQAVLFEEYVDANT
jgi:site-specific DNA-methyltransferase (adenine-specific)